MSKTTTSIYVRCDPKLKADFYDVADQLGVDASVLFRDAMEAVVDHRRMLSQWLQTLRAVGVITEKHIDMDRRVS